MFKFTWLESNWTSTWPMNPWKAAKYKGSISGLENPFEPWIAAHYKEYWQRVPVWQSILYLPPWTCGICQWWLKMGIKALENKLLFLFLVLRQSIASACFSLAAVVTLVASCVFGDFRKHISDEFLIEFQYYFWKLSCCKRSLAVRLWKPADFCKAMSASLL